MSALRPGVRRLFHWLARGPADRMQDIDDELEAVIAARADALAEQGVPAGEARDAAVRALGAPVHSVRAHLHRAAEHNARRLRLRDYLTDAAQDVRYAVRGLLGTPGFTAVVLLTLAIGIGATTAIFSAVDALLLRPLPFAEPAQLMQLSLVAPDMGRLTGDDAMLWSYPKFDAFRSRQRAFSSMAVHEDMQFVVTAPGTELIRGESVGATYLRTLGVPIAVGRDMDTTFDANPTGADEVVLGYDLWRRRYASDPGVIGRMLEIDHAPYTIVGVAQPGFRGLSGEAELFAPLTARRGAGLKGAHSYVFSVIARRMASVTRQQAIAETSILGRQVNHEFPRAGSPDSSWSARAVPLDGIRVSPLVRRSVLILFGAVSLVLLIACANVANLLLGRASKRQREISVRLAIGASGGRLVRLLVAESLVLAAAGGACGLVLAWAGAHALSALDPTAALGTTGVRGFGAVSFSSIHLDWRALAFTASAVLVIGLLFGLMPAIAVRRVSLATALRAGATERDARGAAKVGGRRALVVAEVALSMVLLAGSGLMLRSLARLLATDYGFDGTHVLALRITAFPQGPVTDVFASFWANVNTELRGLPGVQEVGLSDCGPLEGGGCGATVLKTRDGIAVGAEDSPLVGVQAADSAWFAALRVPLRRGRLFGLADVANAPPVAVINEAAARALFPGQNAIGHSLGTRGAMDGTATVVGIVGNVRQFPDSAPPPAIYLPVSQDGRQRLEVFVRTGQDPGAVAATVQRAIRADIPSAVIDKIQTMDARTGAATARARFGTLLIGLFAATALSLALIGVYGVMSLAVGARTREIGVRIALGADASRVRRLIVGDAMGLVLLGGALGIAGAVVCTRALRSLLFDLTTTDPFTYGAVALLLVITAAGAAWIPARRASRVDPMQALRVD